MKHSYLYRFRRGWVLGTVIMATVPILALAAGQEPAPMGKTSYAPVAVEEGFDSVVSRMTEAKPAIQKRHKKLLEERYDLSDQPASGVKMSRGKAVQGGVRVKLPSGVTWDGLAAMSADEIRGKGLWPAGFYPLPHPNHAEGGMLFPKFHIDEIKKQTGRDLTRFDLDFVMPEHFLPEFPPAIFLTTRPDLEDVSQGKVVTTENYYDLFNGIFNPKQLRGIASVGDSVPSAAVQRDHRPAQPEA